MRRKRRRLIDHFIEVRNRDDLVPSQDVVELVQDTLRVSTGSERELIKVIGASSLRGIISSGIATIGTIVRTITDIGSSRSPITSTSLTVKYNVDRIRQRIGKEVLQHGNSNIVPDMTADAPAIVGEDVVSELA